MKGKIEACNHHFLYKNKKTLLMDQYQLIIYKMISYYSSKFKIDLANFLALKTD